MFAILVKSEDTGPAATHKLFAFKTDQKTVSHNLNFIFIVLVFRSHSKLNVLNSGGFRNLERGGLSHTHLRSCWKSELNISKQL